METTKKYLVTILMTTYNSEKYLSFAINSIINQSYTNWELIIIDDYSSDNSYKIATEWANKYNKIIAIRNDMNYGTFYSLNQGLKTSKGDYITKLDSDDIFDKDKIKLQLETCIKFNVECCSCNIIRTNNLNSLESIKNENINSSIFFSRKIFNEIGYFDNCRFECDSEYFNRISKLFQIKHINKNLYIASIRNNSLTNSNITGVKFNSYGNKVRSEFRKNYTKYIPKYIIHPKYFRNNYKVNPILLCPIEINFIGSYKIINSHSDKLSFDALDDNLLGIVVYKLSKNKNILFNNLYKLKIYSLKGNLIGESLYKNTTFITNDKYIKLVIEFKLGYNEYYPIILN